jgi:hypothetical protein
MYDGVMAPDDFIGLDYVNCITLQSVKKMAVFWVVAPCGSLLGCSAV